MSGQELSIMINFYYITMLSTVFSTDSDLQLLTRCQWVYMNRTFKTARHLYVHAMLNDHVVKFAAALIANKNQNSYQRLL